MPLKRELRKRDARRLIVAFAFLTLGPLVALTVFAVHISGDAMRKDVNDKLQTISSSSATFIQTDLISVAEIVDAYSKRVTIVNALADGKIDDIERPRVEVPLTELTQARPNLAGSSIANLDGRLLMSYPFDQRLVEFDATSRDWFQGVSGTGRPYISSAFMSAAGAEPVSAAATPIRATGNGQILGYLVTGYSLKGVEAHAQSVGRTFDVQLTVTDQHGVVVAAPGEAPTTLISRRDDSRVAAALAGNSDVTEISDDRGRVLSAYAPMPETGWAVIAETPTETALAQLDRSRRAIVGAAAFSAVVLVAGLALLATTLRRRGQAETALAVARDEAMEASRLKSEFLANMSHEVRTPLNGILGMSSLLLSSPLRDDQHEQAQMIRTSGESLLSVINDILDFSKIEAGKLELERIDFNLREVVEDAVTLFGDQAAAKDIELTIAPTPPEVPRVVYGDPSRLRQVLLNLIGNAVKFTSTGEVVVSCTTDDITTDGDGKMLAVVRFEVRDTGPGIPEEHRARLFESFSQADASAARRFGGSGLGLAISKRLTQLMGGELDWESEVGVGSTFWFSMPFVVDTKASLVDELSSDLHDVRVLIVDDNATNRLVLEGHAERWLMQPVAVDSGVSALAALRDAASRDDPFAIALIDHQMPEMDGIELARRIREDDSIASTRLILLTSSAAYGSIRASHDIGIDAYLVKPVREVALRHRISGVLGVAPTSQTLSNVNGLIASNGERRRVLVVEDNMINQEVAVGMLSQMGCVVERAASGAEAVERVARNNYDVIFMDVQMPGMDGYEATRRIRANEAPGLRTLIVAMTASAMDRDRERATAAGMDDFISKPVDWSKLAEALRQWTSGMPLSNQPPAREAPARTATESGDSDVIDLRVIEQLRFIESEGGLVQLFDQFEENALELIADLGDALAHDQVETAANIAHTLKGASGSVGAIRLSSLSAELESALLTRDVPAAHQLATSLPHVLRDFLSDLKRRQVL